MKKILMISDGMYLHSGVSIVTRNITKNIYNNYDIRSFSLACRADKEEKENLNIYEYMPKDSKNILSSVQDAIKSFDPDIVFTIHDIWNLSFLSELFYNRRFHWLAYFPVDVGPYPNKITISENRQLDLKSITANIDSIVAYTDFGAQTLIEYGLNSVVDTIHHGVNTDEFKIDDVARVKWRRRLNIPDDAILFTSIGVNIFRKGFDNLLLAWKIFMEKYRLKAKLYLHTNPNGKLGWDLPDLIETIGVKDSVILPFSTAGINIDDMRGIYNASDIFVLASMGEGFGLPLLESIACGTPIMFIDYAGPSTIDIYRQCGVPIPYNACFYYHRMNSKYVIPDINYMADMMGKLSTDNEYRKTFIEKGQMLIKDYDWKIICTRWKQLLDSIDIKKSRISNIRRY